MRRRAVTLSNLPALMGLAFAAACSPGTEGAGSGDGTLEGRITITGSSTVAPLMGEVARRFEAEHPGVRVDVQTGGTSRGIADVRRRVAQIGMISRGLRPEEEDLDAVAVALDGITLIVHRDNHVATLSHDQVVDIFTGRVRRWDTVGGREAEITVVSKADGRATLELFLDHFGLRRDEIHPSLVIGDNQHGIRSVAGDPAAIAYVSIGTAAFESSQGRAIRMLPLDGVEPTLAAVQSGEFPASRPLNLVTFGDRSPPVQAFLSFAASERVQDLVEAQYFVPAPR